MPCENSNSYAAFPAIARLAPTNWDERCTICASHCPRAAVSEIRTVQNQAYALLMDTLDWLFCECYTSIEINTLKSPAGLLSNETIARLWMLQTVKVQDAPRNKRRARRG